jgi:Rrf2 family protein
MKLSKRSEYGLRALLDLAAHSDQGPLRLKDLAGRNNIPIKFLEQIFLTLRNAGVVRSQVGARGGYTLGRPAEEITLGEVIRALDGTIAPVGCVSVIAYEPCTCADERTCALRAAMKQVRDAIVAVVDHTSLADAVTRGKAGHKSQISNFTPRKNGRQALKSQRRTR